jgi:hypothetical protein
LKIFPELSEKIYRPSSQSILLKSGILFLLCCSTENEKQREDSNVYRKFITTFEIEQEEYFNHLVEVGIGNITNSEG